MVPCQRVWCFWSFEGKLCLRLQEASSPRTLLDWLILENEDIFFFGMAGKHTPCDKVPYTTRQESFLTVSNCSPVMGLFCQETGLSQGLYMNSTTHTQKSHACIHVRWDVNSRSRSLMSLDTAVLLSEITAMCTVCTHCLLVWSALFHKLCIYFL